MKRFLSMVVGVVGLAALAGVAAAQWGGGASDGQWDGMGPGMMGGGRGGWMRGGAPCRNFEAASAQITEDKAKELAQGYADKYLAGFKVERVLPFTGRFHTLYSVELKNETGEARSLHINPYGNVMPFGGPWQHRS